MRVRGRLPLVVVLGAALLLCGCTDDRPTRRSDAQPDTPRLGGRPPAHQESPTEAMNGLERPVAERLARQIAADGLTLEHLDCPRWDHVLPGRMTCTGYVDGLVARIRVDLSASRQGEVRFGARMVDGMVATRKLERTLLRLGWTGPDCGQVAAYPARPGSRIRCRVTRSGRSRYVVATVDDRAGGVSIAADRGAPAE